MYTQPVTDPYEQLRAIADVEDPAERARQAGAALAELTKVQAELREVRQGAVLEMREDGLSHAQVAEQLGVTRSRAQQIAEGRTTTAAGTSPRPRKSA